MEKENNNNTNQGESEMKNDMKELSMKEIVAKGKTYDNVQNEGGSGYNPYWAEIERQNMEEANARASKPKSKEQRVEDLYERIRKECGSVSREWGNEEADKKQSELYSEIEKIEKEIEAEFRVEWTEEETIRRRADWNAFVNSEGFIKDRRNINKRQINQGWTMADLKKAVKMYGL